MIKRFLVVPLLLVGFTALSAEAQTTQPSVQGSGDDTALVTLLYTNDLHGRVHLPDRLQGMAKLATLARQIRKERPGALLLNAGDTIHGTPAMKMFRGKPIIDAMNAEGYDAAALGNHEFDAGQRVLRDMLAQSQFPWLSANVLASDGGSWDERILPYVIHEIDGARVGIFGLTTPFTVRIQWPRTIEGIEFHDPIEVSREMVRKLREEEDVDVVVGLSHLGHSPDREVAAAVDGIDVILGGHTHRVVEEQDWVNGTLILNTGCYGEYLGRVDLLLEKTDDGYEIAAINGKDDKWWGHNAPAPEGWVAQRPPTGPLLSVPEGTPDDPEVVARYAPYAREVERHLAEHLTTLSEPIPPAGSEGYDLADFLAEAVRSQAEADVGLVMPKAFRDAKLAAGEVHVEDIYRLLGAYTRQHVVIMDVPGRHLKALAEQFKGDEPALVAAGLSFENGKAMIDGQPVQDDEMYRVAGPAYVPQEHLLGRDGIEIITDDAEDPTLRDAAIATLRERGARASATTRPAGQPAAAR